MLKTLGLLLKAGKATQTELFPTLPSYSRGLPTLTTAKCADACTACAEICPTEAIDIKESIGGGQSVSLDLGKCIACGQCEITCPTQTITTDRRTAVAVRSRAELILRSDIPAPSKDVLNKRRQNGAQFSHSLQIRVVATGDSATDLEIAATDNPIFDASRFGIQVVASPRFADALLISGPVAHSMQEPLKRCYEAMGAPRFVVAVGASAISGGIYNGGYASAAGVDSILPVDAYVPGSPPHPWSILHGLKLIMEPEELPE